MWARLKNNQQAGFTIVELLVVIVVIAILASISVMAFTGVQQRARDAVRTTDLSNIAKTLQIYSIQNNGDTFGNGSGCGAYGEGSGWWHTEEEAYPYSTRECLVNAGYTQVKDILDPSGCSGGETMDCAGKPRYMILQCNKDSRPVVYLLAKLEGREEDNTFADNLCDGGMAAGFPAAITSWDTAYGMNYLLQVK